MCKRGVRQRFIAYLAGRTQKIERSLRKCWGTRKGGEWLGKRSCSDGSQNSKGAQRAMSHITPTLLPHAGRQLRDVFLEI